MSRTCCVVDARHVVNDVMAIGYFGFVFFGLSAWYLAKEKSCCFGSVPVDDGLRLD